MQRVITGVILAPLVLLAVFKAPLWLFAIIVALLALLCTGEYLDIAASHDLKPLRVLTYLSVLAVLGNYYLSIVIRGLRPEQVSGWQIMADPFWEYEILLLLVSASPFVILLAALRTENLRQALPSAAVSYLAVPYIGITCGFLLFNRGLVADGSFAIFYLLLVVWAGDIFAYYVGRSIGRHKLAEHVSPGKSWEGAAASVIGSMIIGTLILVYNQPIAAKLFEWKLLSGRSILGGQELPTANPVWIAILASASINVAAQFGDLVESMMKRGAQIKDSGKLLPGHGGMLDRVDALLLASPVLWYYCSFRLVHF
jgi:phosphatidate cytidylyltransferase